MKYNEELVKEIIDKFKSMNYKPEDITLYFDMDNVMCLFSVFGDEDIAVKRMFHKGYFKELQCFPEVPAVIENLQRIGFKVKVLSSCIDRLLHKCYIAWYQENYPEVINILNKQKFLIKGENKNDD